MTKKNNPQSYFSLAIMLTILMLFNAGIHFLSLLHRIDITFIMAILCWFGSEYIRKYIPTDIFPGVKIVGLVLFLSSVFFFFFPAFPQEAIAVSLFVLIGHNMHQSGKY